MTLILIDSLSGKQRFLLGNPLLVGLVLASLTSLIATTGYVAYKFGIEEATLSSGVVSRWQKLLGEQRETLEDLQQEAQYNLEATTLRLAQLQARIVRLDALGERLIKTANLDAGEFDFSQLPGMGGPDDSTLPVQQTSLVSAERLHRLAQDIEDREQQLAVLDLLLIAQKTKKDFSPTGRPVQKGWMSSGYGYRNDPITGRRAWHRGVDFAGKAGANIIASAAGVVTFAGERGGYGRMVEINHGDDYTTRYGHQQQLNVETGDVVRRGEVIGELGTSGRSTGPHVHFEVFKNGRTVDPASYIHRTRR